MCIALHIYIKYIPDVQYVYLNKNVKEPCMLPDVDPFDAAILKYVWTPDPLVCDQTPLLTFFDRKGLLHVNTTAIRVRGLENINCTFSIVHRKDDYQLEFEQEIAHDLEQPIYVPADVVRTRCYDHKNDLKQDHILLNVDYRTVTQNKNLQDETNDNLSVYIFGIDSTSRLNAERKLKKTLRYIREELGGYVFEGHTKIAENTYPNLVPFLVGIKAYTPEMSMDVNDILFIWNKFSRKGYVTYFTEDAPQMSMFRGFTNPPSDHYILPFFIALRQLRSYKIHDAMLFFEAQRIKLSKSSTLCYGDTPKFRLLMDYFERFFDVYHKKRKFIMSWFNELTHDHLNMLEHADDHLYNHFKFLKDRRHLDNTVLIFTSDHGIRVNAVRNTAIGRVEDRMPFFSIVLPNHLKERYPHIHRAMTLNTKTLTTHWDGFALLTDILNQNFKKRPAFRISDKLPRGISLLREIPKRRTCFDAEIQEHYCPCYSSYRISTQQPFLYQIAKVIVDQLNSDLEIFRDKCAILTLEYIDTAELINSNFQRDETHEEFSFKKYLNVFSSRSNLPSRYLVVVMTSPGHALFESTVNYRNKHDIELLGDINRINRYGNQSSCINHKVLRTSCYCIR